MTGDDLDAARRRGEELAAAAVDAELANRERRLRTRRGLTAEQAFEAPAAPPALDTAFARSAGVLVAEGDSWFDYPGADVLSALEDDFGFDALSVARAGDTVESMAYLPAQHQAVARLLLRQLEQGPRPRAILLSGGGNDIAGSEFAMLLNHALSPHPGVNAQVAAGVIAERARDAYLTIIQAVTDICRRVLGSPLRIVLHGYDFPVPDGRGFLGGFGPLPGPWLGPGFAAKGFPESRMADRKAAMVELIDGFNAMLDGLTGLPGLGHVRYADLRGTLSTGADYRNWWANELHPTDRGFQAVAQKFNTAITAT